MYEDRLKQLNESLSEVYKLDEATKKEPTRKLFGLDFAEYDAYRELSHDMVYGKANPDPKWLKRIEDQINQIQKNKKEWKKFEDAYNRGNWQDYVYDVEIDDQGNWTSSKRKLKGDELRKRKIQNKRLSKLK